ncbi:MAG: hypothetical protein HQK89_07880 [Nitrospirae bacterium]|nr:hypothetical protein [Nitrospirota bacterium]
MIYRKIYRKDTFVKNAMFEFMLLPALMVVVFVFAGPSSAFAITGNRTTVLTFSLLDHSGSSTGQLNINYIINSNPAPPYGYPYEIAIQTVTPSSVCSTEPITGGNFDSWLNRVYSASDLAGLGIFGYSVAGVAQFGSDYGDGSSATYYPCTGSPFNAKQGALYLLLYSSSYDLSNGTYRVGELIVCEDSSTTNCVYYYMYGNTKLF